MVYFPMPTIPIIGTSYILPIAIAFGIPCLKHTTALQVSPALPHPIHLEHTIVGDILSKRSTSSSTVEDLNQKFEKSIHSGDTVNLLLKPRKNSTEQINSTDFFTHLQIHKSMSQ